MLAKHNHCLHCSADVTVVVTVSVCVPLFLPSLPSVTSSLLPCTGDHSTSAVSCFNNSIFFFVRSQRNIILYSGVYFATLFPASIHTFLKQIQDSTFYIAINFWITCVLNGFEILFSNNVRVQQWVPILRPCLRADMRDDRWRTSPGMRARLLRGLLLSIRHGPRWVYVWKNSLCIIWEISLK